LPCSQSPTNLKLILLSVHVNGAETSLFDVTHFVEDFFWAAPFIDTPLCHPSVAFSDAEFGPMLA